MSTYVPIQAITLSADTATVTFTNIPQTFTDLILVCNYGTSAIGRTGSMRFNNDSATNYSWRALGGNGTSASSSGGSNMTSFYFTGQITGDGTALANVSTTHIQNYSNATTYKTALSRSNDAARYVEAAVGTWRSTSAINRIDVTRDNGTNWLSGSTFTLYGIGSGSPKAFGGSTVTTDGTYWYHTYTSSGLFIPTTSLTNVDYLVIAGAGGGGGWQGGGGGAGGYRTSAGTSGGGGGAESKLSLTANTSYTVTIGAGGTGGPYATPGTGTSGSNSVFSTITSTGGGGGGGGGAGDSNTVGSNGGSGGGGSLRSTNAAAGGTGTANQGYAGGAGAIGNSGGYATGGGGGAGAVGGTPGNSGTTGGNGGTGVASTISGTSVTRAAGGGGHGSTAGGTGGTGGGGNGSTGTGACTAGTANTGSGGGGGRDQAGANGGSGIVIVRYAV